MHFGSCQLKWDLNILLLITFCCNNETLPSIVGWTTPKRMFAVEHNLPRRLLGGDCKVGSVGVAGPKIRQNLLGVEPLLRAKFQPRSPDGVGTYSKRTHCQM